ncbi:PREDICTED: uncharacterized protein LOC108777137, partial [Cyphomyrmex costatus]|uniref:uncharacterized protein LOC108777137 n=1 Tax=Cyphomyrmex costatus TaxID=456900 RepID=UPI00085222B7
MTLTGSPEWIEEDQIVSVQGYIGEDIIIELKLALSENYDDLRFELIRDGLPISSDHYQLSMRGNIVQLTLKKSRKSDTGYYSLVATRHGQENDKGALKKFDLSINEPNYEEDDPPVFLRRLSDLAVKVGTRTKFLVEIRSSTTLKITWYKDASPIQNGPRFSLIHEGNFHCVDVVPVTVEDQGCWTCIAENRSGRSSCTSTLTVIVPKAYKKPEFVEELRALLTEAGTVSLECKVIGVPTPVLKWFKDNKEIKAGDVFALTANPDDPTSLGVYTCEAVNYMGTAYSSSKVHVVGRGNREESLKSADALALFGLLPIFKQILQDECCRIGDTIILSCRVQVPPWPKAISWYNKEGRIESSEKYHVMEDGIGGYSIEIKQVEAMDEGEWKCVVTSEENIKQFTSCYVAMSIPRNYRKPRFMENLNAILTEEGLVSFECKVVGFPTPLLRWFKDGQELKPGDVYQLTGTNSLGSYCCIARNCMGEAKSTTELTIEDIQNQLNEEERFQLLSTNLPPKFIKGLRSCEAKINENFRFTVQVSIAPKPILSWYRDDAIMDESDKYHMAKENLGTCHFEVQNLEFIDQAEWKCVAVNDFGHSVTSCFLKLIIPKHYKKPKFLENLRAILSEEGAVNLECKVIGIPQPVLKWYKNNVELKPGDIHRIISGQDGTCCLGIYTCEATNCMGTVSSSASLLGFEDKIDAKVIQASNGHELARNLSLSTIHEERTSQLYDTPQTDHSVTLDERGEVSFSFDGKEVSVSLYETPDLTEEEALQIVEMYADQLSEHVTEHNVIELPPMRFVKETSTTSNLVMEAVIIDISPDYFVSAEDDDLRTEADFEDVSIMDDVNVLSSLDRDSRSSLKRSVRYNEDKDEKVLNKPPRKKSMSLSLSKSEKSQRIESESFHSTQKDEPPLSPLSSLKQDDSDTFADALSSPHFSITESFIQKQLTLKHGITDNRKRSLSAESSPYSSLDDGIGCDSSVDSMVGVPKKKQRKKKQQKDKNNSEKYSGPSNYDQKRSESEDKIDMQMKYQFIEPIEEMDNRNDIETVKELFTKEELLDNLKNVKKINSHISEENQESTQDILFESRIALRSSLKLLYNKVFDVPQFLNIYKRIDDICQLLEGSRRTGVDIEILANLDALLQEINEITPIEHIEIILNILEPFIAKLSHVIKNFELLSLQPTFAILKKFNDDICNISERINKLSSLKSISDMSQNISKEIEEPLINVQLIFNRILDYIEQSKLTINGSSSPQQFVTASDLIACLTELRECVSHTAHTAMTLKENEILNSLMEFKDPLLHLQLTLAQRCTSSELSMTQEINFVIVKLKNVVNTILKKFENHDIISRIEGTLNILKNIDEQISELVEQLSKTKIIQNMLKDLNIDQSLSNVHFALSSVLEKQEKYVTSCHLITSIEALRQTIGSSAVTIANLKNPTDDEIIQEISKLSESLLNLQRDLLTEKHEPQEEQVLNDLMNPISILKEIIHNVIENSSSIELIVPMLELLEDIEKDTALITKEISKKKHEENITQSQRENKEERSYSKSNLVSQIDRSLDPIKNWLSATSEDSIKLYEDETKSTLSLTIQELKRNVNQIVIRTSYSESPNDDSLIDALIDLREPLLRLKNAISVYHDPEDLAILKNLDYPMKYLLQTIMDILREHAEEESIQPIIDIIEEIKNQIPFSVKYLHQQEFKQNAKPFNVGTEEIEEETVTASRETIPGTLTEVASTPFEAESISLLIEQAITKNNSSDVILQTIKNEKQESEEGASKLITILSETLEKLQLEITSILEDFEESTQSTTIPQSKLATSIEELRRTISTIRVITVYNTETALFEEKLNQTLMLTNLIQPLTNIRNLLSKSHEHDVSELMILNRFIPLLNIIENNVIRQIKNFIGKDKDIEEEFEFLLYILEEIKTKIPIVIQKISLRQKILEYLWNISKPLENILERMSDLEKAAEETLETDVANILGKPIAALLEDIKSTIQKVDMLERREPLIFELQNLLEPLLEFHSCLSMVQSSRRSLVPEDSLLDEKKSVILRAVDGLRKQVCHTVEIIANMEESLLFNKSLTLLNSAILQVQKQIGKTDYSRRSSSTNISLQYRLTGTLNRLHNAIITLKERTDKNTYDIVSNCLEALQKQISFAQTQFRQVGSELIAEEAIVEGFLYPTNQLLSALNILKENVEQMPSAISYNLIVQFQELAASISELSSSLSDHKIILVQEGAFEGAPIIETFSAVIDVLNHVKDSIHVIKKTVEQKRSMIITNVESVINEIIEVSQEEAESVMMNTEMSSSKAIIQEVVQSEIKNTSTTVQIPILEDLETVISVEQSKNDLADVRKNKKNQEENEKGKHLTSEITKFNSVISNLIQPLKELIDLIKSAKQECLTSKSEEDKRKIQELTALIQILNDLQATNTSIKTVISFSSISILLDSQFSHMENILADFERAANTIIFLTHEGLKPELKETIIASLPLISKPLEALENVLTSIYQTIDKNKHINKDEELSAIPKILISYINDAIKFLNEIQISKCVSIADDKEIKISEIKEETKAVEETTAQCLEEFIEDTMESQKQVQCDKTLLLDSSLSSTDMIESKAIDNLKPVEAELGKTLTKEIDDSIKQDAIEIPQQELKSLESSQIEELLLENIEVIKSVTEPLEKVEKHDLATTDEEKLVSIQISENSMIQKEQIKDETLEAIISSLQTLYKSFNEIGEIRILEPFNKKTITFSNLTKQLLNLQLELPSKVTEGIKTNTLTLLKLSVKVLEELQTSIATVQEQMQLNATKTSSNETSKSFLLQAVMEPLNDLKMSIACMQSDSTIIQLIQQEAELSNVKQIMILQNLVQSVVECSERFIHIINQVKIESVPPLKIIKQKDQGLDPKVLHKIVDSIHILRETLSQIKNLNIYKAGLLEMPEWKKEIAQLGIVIDSFEKLEQLLLIDTQQIVVMEEEEHGESQNLLRTNLKLVLEELRNSIILVQEQTILNDVPMLKTLNKVLENLKLPLITFKELVDYNDKITETEKKSILLSFANSVEEITSQLMVTNEQDVEKQAISEASLLKIVTIPIEELQSAILKLDDQISQTLETRESTKAVTLEYMIQPLQELQQSFLTASYEETDLTLQQLSIKSILDNLNKSMTIILDQVSIIQDNVLMDINTDDLVTLKDFAGSLNNLKMSMAVLQQLSVIETADRQIAEIENASALQAFVKSIIEFNKCCSIIVKRPRIIEAFTNIELKQSNQIDTHLIENIIVPLRLLQEQILTIKEIKMQESEILNVTEIRKPVTVLSSLVSPLQQLEKSFVATVQKEHIIEHDTHSLITESSFVNLEKFALQPILEEVQKSIAIVQEHVILETGSQITSEVETDTLLKSIAQPLVDLRASIASIQQITAIAPDFLNELVQQQNISALNTFAKTLHNLTERIAMCNYQQIVIEPEADTLSEDVSSLNTWADVIEESSSKITRSMVIDQGVIESPVEIAASMTEDETSTLKTLAKPLTELRQCLALIVEEQKTIQQYDTTCSLSEKENISLMKTIIQPLLELKHAAAIIIEEQMTIERANEHSFAIDGKNEFILRLLIEPLEELRHSIAVIQDHMLVETSTDRSKNDVILNALVEPLFDLQRAISILETRVISPDVESMSEDADNWITECLATPLHEIEKSIADIQQCNIIESETIIVKEQTRTLIQDWSVIEKLVKSVESIKLAISCIQNDSTEIEILKMMEISFINIQENLMLLKNEFNLDTVERKSNIDVFIESLSNFEKCILFLKEEIDKAISKQSDTTEVDTIISATLIIPLIELKRSFEIIKASSSVYLNYLERPLELILKALKTVIFMQQNKKLLELSIKCIIQIQEKSNTNLMISALQSLEKSISIIQQQSTDKSLVDPQHTNFGSLLKRLIPCLFELQESIEVTKTLWCEETILDGLMILEKPICKLLTVINIISNQSLQETISLTDKYETALQEKSIKEKIIISEVETAVEKDNKPKKKMEETKLGKDTESTVINDMKDEEDAKKPEKVKQKEEINDKKLTMLTHKENVNQIENRNEKQQEKNEKKKSAKKESVQQEIKEEKHEQSEHQNIIEEAARQEQKKEKIVEKIKEEENDKTRNQKIEDKKRKKERLKEQEQKEKEISEKIKEEEKTDLLTGELGKKEEKIKQEQKEQVEEIKKQVKELNKEMIIEVKEGENKEIKSKKAEKLKKKEGGAVKREEIIKQGKEDEIKISRKEDEEQKGTINLEEIAQDEQINTKNIEEDKQIATQKRHKIESKEIKRIIEKSTEKEKDEIVETEEITQQTQHRYTNDIKKENDTNKSGRKNKEIIEDQEQNQITQIKQNQKEKVKNKDIQELRRDKNLCLSVDEDKKQRSNEKIFQKQQGYNNSDIKEEAFLKKEEEWKQQKLQSNDNWLYMREECVNRSSEHRVQEEENNYQDRDIDKKLHRMEMGKIRRDETVRLLWEEKQRLRKRREEERFRNKQSITQRIRENEWSRKRENESDCFLRNMLEDTYKLDKSTSIFSNVNYTQQYIFRFNSHIPMLSSISRSYNWRNSLTSLSEKRFDNYWDYKLHSPSMDKYYFDTGSLYRRRKKRENYMIRARSTNLLKYEDYSTICRDSDITIVPSPGIRSLRHTKVNTISRIDFNTWKSEPSSFTDLCQNESLQWNKSKKPSFCSKLTNRIVEVGMRTRLTCIVLGNPEPHIYWTKDDQKLDASGNRYKTRFENGMAYLELHDVLPEDAGIYTCVAENTHGTSNTESILKVYSDHKPIHSPPTFVKSIKDWLSINQSNSRLSDEIRSKFVQRPRFSNLPKNYSMLTDGSIGLEVELKDILSPEAKWQRGDQTKPITVPKARIFVEPELYTLITPDATEPERDPYVCRTINAYGQMDTNATMHVMSLSAGEHRGKPAIFVSRPSKKPIDVIVGEDISISFRVSGIPKPRIIWMKGLTDITDGPRSYKESTDDYVRLILKKVIPSDEGTYCILVKNRYGCDRSFFSVKIKPRAKSLTQLSNWNPVTDHDAEECNDDMSYIRNVPGPISSEPVVIDGGKSWLSLSWGKAKKRGPTPVVAYKVEAWLLGGGGGARWAELGITPINVFDAFNLRPGGEYKFRVTPRNRYGWGESVTMRNSVLVIESTDLPELTKILPDQLKALEGTSVKLECEIRGDSRMKVQWYRETTEINPYNDTRFTICSDGSKCSLTIVNVKEDDSGRYVCEANSRIGKVSSFARVLVVTDPRIIEADAKLKSSSSIELENRPPQFTLRIRDRRVQTTYPVRLTCQVIGHPVPEIVWYKDGTEISQDDRHIFWNDDSSFYTLEIIQSTLEDSGYYTVTARNINGSVSCRCTLVVDKGIRAYIAPEFLRDLNVTYTVHSGGELRMSAQLKAYPCVGVVWHRDGFRLRPNRRAIMTLSHDGTVQFSLADVTTRDAGVYSCTATNVVGQIESSTRVIVTTAIQDQSFISKSVDITSLDIPYSKEPLFITKPLSTEAIEGDTVIILCEVVGDPKPEVIWLRDFLKPNYYKDAPHFRLVGVGPQYRLEIPYAKLDFTGTYSVIARNCYGEAKTVISLQIYTKGQGKEEQTQKSPHGKILTLPIIKRELRDFRCCDGDAVSLECKVYATPEPPLIRWERGDKIITMVGDFAAEFDGETARLNIQHVYPEDEGEYTCVAYNNLGKAYTSACLVVDVPEGEENILSQRLIRPMDLLSAGSTPRLTSRSTPIRSLSPAAHGREFRLLQVLPQSDVSKRPKVFPPKFYAVPHNRLVQEGETVRFQCAIVGYPAPWIRWDKNGTIVTSSTRFSIKERDDIKILEIIDVMREDAALYRVTAENDFGRIEASARLEVINRYESISRTIRTRSASPRTCPSFNRSLLPITSRINSRLQLECPIRGSPNVSSMWNRNGRLLERSSRVKRYFDSTTARIEISKMKASDAGEYIYVATNILGSTRSSCQVTVLSPHDLSIADKNAPQFLQSLPKESIVMENYAHISL